MSVTGQVQRDEWLLQREGHGVKGVSVLGSAVEEDVLGILVAPRQTADLAKSVDRDEEPTNRRHSNIEIPLAQVLVKQRELVVRSFLHTPNGRRCLIEMGE